MTVERTPRPSRGYLFALTATLVAILAGPLLHTYGLSRVAGRLTWMQTAYDEPYYIQNAIADDLAFDSRVLGRLPAKLLRGAGIDGFDRIAIAYDLVLPVLALLAALFVARRLSKSRIESLAWALALLLAWDVLSLNSSVLFAPTLASRLEAAIGAPWLFAADPFPYFNLFRTPEPQTSWIVFLFYLGLLCRYADTANLRSYQAACLLTPCLSILYVSVAITAWLVFLLFSLSLLLVLRVREILVWFATTLAVTVAALVLLFSGDSAREATSMAIFRSHLPILRPSVLLGLGLCGYVIHSVRTGRAPLDGRRLLAGACALVPVATLNQQILTGRIVIAQQWELFANYIVLVMAAGLVLGAPSRRDAPQWPGRRAAAVACWALLLSLLVAGQRTTWNNFLPTNLLSIAEARAYEDAVRRSGPSAKVVLPESWDDALFTLRVANGANALGGFWWIRKIRPTSLGPEDSWSDHYARNGARIDIGYEVLARREITPAALDATLRRELQAGVCWPNLTYFFSEEDCWSRFSNFIIEPTRRLEPMIPEIVEGYRRYLEVAWQAPDASRVLVITREPLDPGSPLGLWRYERVGEAHIRAGMSDVKAYAYAQSAGERGANPPR